MNKISIYLATSLMIVCTIVGIGIGYLLTPQYTLTMYDKTTMDLGRADKWLDLRYIDAMIAHHRGAILIAKQAEVSTRPEVKNLALEIQRSEPLLITELYAWKKAWYNDTRSVKDPIVPNLGSYDTSFDLRFLNALIAHHAAGVVMTRDVRAKSTRSEILNNADAVEQFLTTSGTMLKEWRMSWYKI